MLSTVDRRFSDVAQARSVSPVHAWHSPRSLLTFKPDADAGDTLDVGCLLLRHHDPSASLELYRAVTAHRYHYARANDGCDAITPVKPWSMRIRTKRARTFLPRLNLDERFSASRFEPATNARCLTIPIFRFSFYFPPSSSSLSISSLISLRPLLLCSGGYARFCSREISILHESRKSRDLVSLSSPLGELVIHERTDAIDESTNLARYSRQIFDSRTFKSRISSFCRGDLPRSGGFPLRIDL